MFKKFINLFKNRRHWVRQILVAGVAGGVAWFIGDLLIENGGVVAAIVSTLSIRISLHKSMREGFGQLVGTAIGAGIALLAGVAGRALQRLALAGLGAAAERLLVADGAAAASTLAGGGVWA